MSGSLVNNADSCRTLMHDLRASVILLNISTTRIETDVNELAHSIKKYSAGILFIVGCLYMGNFIFVFSKIENISITFQKSKVKS